MCYKQQTMKVNVLDKEGFQLVMNEYVFKDTVFSIKTQSSTSSFSGICSPSKRLSPDPLPAWTGMFLFCSNHSTQLRGFSLSARAGSTSSTGSTSTGSPVHFQSHSFIIPHWGQSVQQFNAQLVKKTYSACALKVSFPL